jgi:hypothetical protein
LFSLLIKTTCVCFGPVSILILLYRHYFFYSFYLSLNGSLDGEKRRNTDHHRSRHGSHGRGKSPPSQKREWPYYPSHPRSAGGPPWNIIRDDFGRAMPSQFHEDPHHPSHFYDPYFISQLVLRATEHDVRKFLCKYVGVPKVKQVIFLQDKRTGRHNGCSYIEVGKLSDVEKELEYDGKIPSFQRFPILMKPSKGDKNYSSAIGVEFAKCNICICNSSILHRNIYAISY